MYESAHDAITFQLLEMSSITTLNQKQFRIFTQGTFFKGFFRKNIGEFIELHNKENDLEITCKRNCFGYWNSCKRLPNFVTVADLRCNSHIVAPIFLPWDFKKEYKKTTIKWSFSYNSFVKLSL